MEILQLKKVIEDNVLLKKHISRIGVFKEVSLVVDFSYEGVLLGVDVDCINGGNVAIFQRNYLSKIFLRKSFNFDWSLSSRYNLISCGVNSEEFLDFFDKINDSSFENRLFHILNSLIRKIDDFKIYNFDAFIGYENNNLLNDISSAEKLHIESSSILDVANFFMQRQCSMLETIDLILEKKISLARFGDGEIRLTNSLSEKIVFQKNSFLLNFKLKEIAKNKNKNLLVALPPPLVENNFWRNFWIKNWHLFKCSLSPSLYADAMITRPEFFKAHGDLAVESWKKIWGGRKVCFITGKGARFNFDHPLFDNINGREVIYSLPTDAFEDIDNVYRCIDKLNSIDIFLIALGPTGTVMADELSKRGCWALDIGHINNSYDHVFLNKETPESLPFK